MTPTAALLALFRVGLVGLVAAAAWRVYQRGLNLDAERVMLQNTWVVVAIYVAAVAAEGLLPVGYILSSVAGLVSGLVASQSVLYIGSRMAWFENREQLLNGWALLGVGGLGVQPYISGPLTNLWVTLWLLCAAMSIYSAAQITNESTTHPKKLGA